MVKVLRIAGGKTSVYTKPTSGSPTLPHTNPGSTDLSKIYFHSDFDYYQLALGPTSVTVNYASVAGQTTSLGSYPDLNYYGQVVQTDYDLLTHSLGYVPNFMVIYNNAVLTPGTMIQNVDDTNGLRLRFATPFATTSKISIMSTGMSNQNALPSLSQSYTVIVFRKPVASGTVDYDFDSSTGTVILGRNKFDSSQKMLRSALPGESSPYDIPLGRTIDINNGRSKSVLADGTTITETGYGGSFSSPTYFQGVVS